MIHTKSKETMTEAKPTIRVIKKGQIGVLERPISANEQPKKEGARRLVANVMNWISDLETRKLEETRVAIERFRRV